jgi:predicted enzyme related to lactoylglutathione lyase
MATRFRVMRIGLTSVFVDDQEKALRFYTEVLGFVKKTDMPAGQFRWLTVVSPEGPDGIELLLEPNADPAAKSFQEAIHQAGIPATSFFTRDVQGEYERMTGLGAVFTTQPTDAEWGTYAVFDDTCGNLISLNQG